MNLICFTIFKSTMVKIMISIIMRATLHSVQDKFFVNFSELSHSIVPTLLSIELVTFRVDQHSAPTQWFVPLFILRVCSTIHLRSCWQAGRQSATLAIYVPGFEQYRTSRPSWIFDLRTSNAFPDHLLSSVISWFARWLFPALSGVHLTPFYVLLWVAQADCVVGYLLSWFWWWHLDYNLQLDYSFLAVGFSMSFLFVRLFRRGIFSSVRILGC